MRILIVSATPFEIAPLLEYLHQEPFQKENDWFFRRGPHDICLLVTGVGAVLTTYALTRVLAKSSFDLVVNAGIAGSYDRSLALGQVVQVVSEQFGDLGAENADGSFTDIFDMGLLDPSLPPFIDGRLMQPIAEPLPGMPAAKGLTVQKVHGYGPSIEASIRQYGAELETMEGAAFFLCCLMEKQPFLALRSISNYVEPRNRENWDIPLAIERLNQALKAFLDTITL
jgi:futalosine hydrolase